MLVAVLLAAAVAAGGLAAAPPDTPRGWRGHPRDRNAARRLGAAARGERRRSARPPARRAGPRAGGSACWDPSPSTCPGLGPLPQRDRRPRDAPPCLPSSMAHTDTSAERARGQRQRVRRRGVAGAGPSPARPHQSPPAMSGSWPRAPRSGSTRFAGPSWRAALARRVRARAGGRRLTGRSRSTRSGATDPSGCARRPPPRGSVEGALLAAAGGRGAGQLGPRRVERQLGPPRVRAARSARREAGCGCRRRALPPHPVRPGIAARPDVAPPRTAAGCRGAAAFGLAGPRL